MTDIYEAMIEAEKVAKERGMYIFQIAKTVASELEYNEIPWFGRGIHLTLGAWDDVVYTKTNPKDMFENVTTKKMQIRLTEHEDQWDDMECDSFSFDLTYEMFISGTNEELKEHFKNKFEMDSDREIKLKNEQTYLGLFEMDSEILLKIIESGKIGNDDLGYYEKINILRNAGANVFDRQG